jgi:hypothetical protein
MPNCSHSFHVVTIAERPPGPIPLILETAMAGGHRIWRERLAIRRNPIWFAARHADEPYNRVSFFTAV